MTKKLLTKSSPKELSKKPESPRQKKFKKANHFTFIGIFKKFEIKHNGFGGDLLGFILEDIREMPSKSLILDSRWFNMNQKFKVAFENYQDEELPGKKVKFEGVKEGYKKGYYTYRNDALISRPEDLEYRILRPTNITVF